MTDFKTDGEIDAFLKVGKAIKKQNNRNMDLTYSNEETKAKIIANALKKKNEILGKEVAQRKLRMPK